jgi:Icc-related predicted phosphoesterase
MKALLVSDLHFEFHRDGGLSFVESLPEADVLLCPGDLSNARGIWDALLLLLEKYPHVIYTYGNHEFYGSDIPRVKAKVEKLVKRLPTMGDKYGKLHVLDNSTCEIEGRRFVGTPLWFRKLPDSPQYERQLNDFYQIGNAHERIYEENEKAIAFLEETVTGDDIVLTHHLPALESVHPKYEGSPLNRFFLCDVSYLINERQPKLWVHGHTHDSCDYTLGKTQVLCNPFGYVAHEENRAFNPELIVEI